MEDVGRRLRSKGLHLRTGGAVGADTAFATGAGEGARTIYVPWRGFNEVSGSDVVLAPDLPNWDNALLVAEEFHPNWEACTHGARKLLARNSYQILGEDLHSPCEFVVCWTKGGKGEGGTGQALRVARGLEPPVPIYDLGDAATLAEFKDGFLPA